MLDLELVRLAKRSKCTYSRYADDITFSTSQKKFPNEIAYEDADGIWRAGEALRNTIRKSEFEINVAKTTMQYKTSRQEVTGLVVNKKVNVDQHYYRLTRSFCNELFQKGVYYIDSIKNEENESVRLIKGTKNQLEGRLSYIYCIRKLYCTYDKNKPTGIIKLYRIFLLYKYFFDNEKPLVVGEGKTDTIYLKSALNALKADFPSLLKEEKGICTYAMSFFNYSNTIKDIFGISSGTSGQIFLIQTIIKYKDYFKNTLNKNNVVFLFDNDDGSKQVGFSKIDYGKDYRISDNAYIIFTTEKENTEIEDLFEESVLNTKVDGKEFSREDNLGNSSKYSKIVFAEKVVKRNRDEINFINFKPLLKRLEKLIVK
jgi:hypothetical protein